MDRENMETFVDTGQQAEVGAGVYTIEVPISDEPISVHEQAGVLLGSIESAQAQIEFQIRRRERIGDKTGDDVQVKMKRGFETDLKNAKDALEEGQFFENSVRELMDRDIVVNNPELQNLLEQVQNTSSPELDSARARVKRAEAAIGGTIRMKKIAESLPLEIRNLRSVQEHVNNLRGVVEKFKREYVDRIEALEQDMEKRDNFFSACEKVEEDLDSKGRVGSLAKRAIGVAKRLVGKVYRRSEQKLDIAKDPFGFLRDKTLRKELDRYGVVTKELDNMIEARLNGEEYQYSNNPPAKLREEILMGIVDEIYPVVEEAEIREEMHAVEETAESYIGQQEESDEGETDISAETKNSESEISEKEEEEDLMNGLMTQIQNWAIEQYDGRIESAEQLEEVNSLMRKGLVELGVSEEGADKVIKGWHQKLKDRANEAKALLPEDVSEEELRNPEDMPEETEDEKKRKERVIEAAKKAAGISLFILMLIAGSASSR